MMAPAEVTPSKVTIDDPLWRRYIRAPETIITRALALTNTRASVVLTNDATVKRFNARDRGQSKPTNVLTYEHPPEIILALGVVLREARAGGKRPAHHLAHLVVHGALHLAGHDHHEAGEARRMERLETRLLSRLGVPNPWKSS
jgi:probable rRNA maturation factor